MTKFLSLFFVLALSLSTWAFDHNHQAFDALLKENLKSKGAQTLVDYKGFQKKEKELDQYLASISAVKKAEYNQFSKNQQLAFLINAYNAFTIKLILDNYPIKSIKKIGGFFSNPWKKKFFTLLEEKQNLDGIEHGTIRKNFNEPRIHFAVNCASLGCPSLMPFAFVGSKIDEQLKTAATRFLTNTNKNKIEGDELQISKIFKWYGEDFEKTHGSVEAFIAPFITSDQAKQKLIAGKKLDREYLDYDWGLNEWK